MAYKPDYRYIINGKPSELAPVYGARGDVVGVVDINGKLKPLPTEFGVSLVGLLHQLFEEAPFIGNIIDGTAGLDLATREEGTLGNMLVRMTGNY
ncbi:MAG TPA: hypothetical protein PLS49_07820 [Candidatus Woesebacteria bacterium]|nr:hypothetical protein [Candidatus Woesebacteria bacterium]